jgi:hypothetical protein
LRWSGRTLRRDKTTARAISSAPIQTTPIAIQGVALREPPVTGRRGAASVAVGGAGDGVAVGGNFVGVLVGVLVGVHVGVIVGGTGVADGVAVGVFVGDLDGVIVGGSAVGVAVGGLTGGPGAGHINKASSNNNSSSARKTITVIVRPESLDRVVILPPCLHQA